MKTRDYGTQQKDTTLLNEEGIHFSTIRINTKEHMPYSTGNSYFGTGTTNRMPTFMEMHPYTWSKEDVYTWLDWCRKEYALSEVPLEKFSMNGKALCVLTKEDFKERAPNVGDVLFNTLQQFASTNLHPSFRNGLPHLLPQMATSAGLLMPAAAAMCNSFIPAAHLQHFLAQAAYPTPMTPDSSPSAPSVSSSNPTPPRNVTPVNQDQKPLIMVTEPSGNSSLVSAAEMNKIPVGVLDTEPSTPSPHSRSIHSSPRRSSPHGDHNGHQETQLAAAEVFKRGTSPANTDNLPVLQEHQNNQDEVKQSESHDGDQPLNLSRRPSESLPTPSPPLLTPYVKAEPPVMPGAGLQAAFRAYLPKNLPSTALANRQLLSVPRSQQSQHTNSTVSSPSIPLVIQKINQSGGEMTVRQSPDPKFAMNRYSNTRAPAIQDLVKEIKKEPGTESLDLSQRNHLTPQYPGQPSLIGSISKSTSPVNAPHTPTYDPISPCDEDDLETPFSPPVTPGGTLLGFTPGTPNGSMPHGRPDGTGKLLWEFLSELLNDPTHQSDPKPIVRWIDMSTYTFQILDTGRLSSLWGQQKNRGTMNYEKLSRALRYYKKVGIIEKAAGKRLTYKFMKPPNSIKRGQRGARPGVPRKNRRHSFLQSQQSVSEEGNTSPRRDTEEQTSTGAGDITPFTIARQFMASGTLKTSLQHVVSQRAEAMRLAGLPSSVAVLAGLPIVVPSSTALHFNGASSGSIATSANSVHVNSTTQSTPTSVKISPKAVTKLSEIENSSSETAENLKIVTAQGEADNEQNILESESERKEEESGRREEEKINKIDESAKSEDEAKSNDIQKPVTENKAVHLGMPVTVPTYDPYANIKTKSKSLSKRRLMSAGDGTVAKKIPRLILPKSTINPETTNSSELGNVGHEEMAE